MIRFVDLGDQITCDGTKEFAWFNTIVDRFIEFNGTHVWETWKDFEEDAEGDEDMDRFKRLFPKEWPQEEGMSEKSIHTEGAVPLHAIKVLEDELKSLKRQRDTFIFQKSYSMRYSGQEIGELETAIKILEKSKEK